MSNTSSPADIVGKKVFFLHPTAVVQNRIIDELIQQDYEVYVAKDQNTLKRVLKKYPDSIVFVDITEKLSEKEWDAWIASIMKSSDTNKVAFGIVTSSDDDRLKQKYIGAFKIPCGYTVLKADLDKPIRQLIDILQAVDAKGRRKYMRVTTENETNTTVNLPLDGRFVKGSIKDVSVVGISCSFEDDPELVRNTFFSDIQVKLQSTLLKVEGIVFGSRLDGREKIYVILFTQRIDPDVRTRIRKYIQLNLQTKMDIELK